MAATSTRTATTSGGGMAIASLVLGIVAILTGWIPFLPVVIALVGLVLGFVDRNSVRRGMAIAGIILCVIEIAWQILYGGALIKHHGHLEYGTPPSQTQTQ